MHKITIKLISILLLLSSFFTFTTAPALAAVTYLYDTNGNMTSDGTNCYTYNEENDLTQVKNCSTNQLIAGYSYDDQGNRGMQKIYQNGVLVQTIYTPYKDFETSKIASTGATQNTSYYTVNGQIAARKNSDGTKTYYHNDKLNSTNVLTNQAGQLVEKTTYYPYGGIQSGGTQSKFLYTGQKQDTETGLDYYNARYYNPQIRRFTQPDTYVENLYNPQDLNEYSYVRNNPLTYNDPTGHEIPVALVLGVSALIGGSFEMQTVDKNIANEYRNTSINPLPFAESKLTAELTAFGHGALDSAAETGLGMVIGMPVEGALTKLGFSRVARSIISTAISGGAIASGKTVYSNIASKSNLSKNVSQTFSSAALVSGASSAVANKLVPAGVGRPVENMSFSLNFSQLSANSTRPVVQEAASDYITQLLGGFLSLFSKK